MSRNLLSPLSLCIATVLLLFVPTAMAAQADPAAEVIPPARACELHVWPGGDLRSTYSGWFHGGIVDGAVQGRTGYRKLPDKPLGSAAQLATLKQLDLPSLLGLPDYTPVWHDTALESRVLRTTPGRLLSGTPTCYAEFAVDDLFFQDNVLTGKSLTAILRFRRFQGDGPPIQTFGAVLAQKLVLFPPVDAAADAGPGIAELSDQFRTAVTRFGAGVQSPPKAKPKRSN